MKKTKQASLLYYLKPESAPFYLKVADQSYGSTSSGASPFPSFVESDPLNRVMQGKIVTDAGITAKDVLLLVQRDEYSFSNDSPCAVTNPDVDRAWQEAFNSYQKNRRDELVLLSMQMSAEGNLARMAPLFFCRRTGAFFSPPCPACGLPLDQCEDDDLLRSAGLEPYTQSLKRYLYCESCSSQGRPRFYAYRTDGIDPSAEDCPGLIKQLGALLHSDGETGEFPCTACRFQDECHGVEQKASLSLVPFAFYPFYLLVLSLPSLHVQQREERENLLAAREHALSLGWSLMASVGKGQQEQFSTEGVCPKSEMLQERDREEAPMSEVTDENAGPVAVASQTTDGSITGKTVTNHEVCRLLAEIRKDWQDRQGASSVPSPENRFDELEMEESVETVFLNIADLDQPAPAETRAKESEGAETVMQPSTQAEPPHDPDKTIILSVSPSQREVDVEKTMILSAAQLEKEFDVEKTVILNAGQTVEATAADGIAPAYGTDKEMTRPIEMEETVIISADYRPVDRGERTVSAVTGSEQGIIQGGATNEPNDKNQDDLMEATVILKIDDRPKTRGSK